MSTPLVFPILPGDLTALGPLFAVLIAALGVLVVDVALKDRKTRDRWTFLLGVVGASLAAATAMLPNAELAGRTILGRALYADHLTALFDLLFAILMGGCLTVSYKTLGRSNLEPAEFSSLVFFSFTGMFLMNRAGELLSLFLAIELMSLPVYVLAGMSASEKTAREAALKYFVLGSLASAILLFGMACLYGSTGSIVYHSISEVLGQSDQAMQPLALAGIALILTGLGFKIGAAPFHMWTPDVYQGAPTAVTTLMATGVKAAGSVALLRFITQAVPHSAGAWSTVVWWLAALSMIAGNFGALTQTNLKRLLAYSSIAHAGYLLIGVLGGVRGHAAFVCYAFLYALGALGTFGMLQWFGTADREPETIDDLAGAGKEHPWAALGLSIFVLSLAGIPPAAGFIVKFQILGAAVQTGYYDLALLGVLTSLIGVAYYSRILIALWMTPTDRPVAVSGNRVSGLVLILLAVSIVFLGCFPSWLWMLAEACVE